MSRGKIGCLVLYAVLAVLAVTQAGSQVGQIASWLIVVLVLAHLAEVLVFFKTAKEAGGSLAAHLVNIFIFGFFHVQEIKRANP